MIALFAAALLAAGLMTRPVWADAEVYKATLPSTAWIITKVDGSTSKGTGVVVNAEKIHATGNKMQDKMYHRFTGYIGNLKSESLGQALERHPERVIEIGVKGMLPKNPLGRAMFKKLKVYAGPNHPHTAQQPQPLEI